MGSQGQGCARWEGLGERTVARAHRGRVAPTHRRRAGQRRGSGCARGRRLARALQEIGVPGGASGRPAGMRGEVPARRKVSRSPLAETALPFLLQMLPLAPLPPH